MTNRKARIDLTNLPARPRQLRAEELQNVFGGCYGRHNVCMTSSECCAPFFCKWSTGSLQPGYIPFQWCEY